MGQRCLGDQGVGCAGNGLAGSPASRASSSKNAGSRMAGNRLAMMQSASTDNGRGEHILPAFRMPRRPASSAKLVEKDGLSKSGFYIF
ncbi:hypothetical protein D3C81_1611310 [compost metagenome]